MKNEKKWYDYLWIGELLYWVLGLCNILFAWLGMLFFTIPMLVALIGGSKAYCNRFCGRGQLLGLLGEKLSRNAPPPRFLRSRWFRYGFLAFFLVMFGLMLHGTYMVFTGAPLRQTVTLLWVFKLPWQWARVDMVAPWIAQRRCTGAGRLVPGRRKPQRKNRRRSAGGNNPAIKWEDCAKTGPTAQNWRNFPWSVHSWGGIITNWACRWAGWARC